MRFFVCLNLRSLRLRMSTVSNPVVFVLIVLQDLSVNTAASFAGTGKVKHLSSSAVFVFNIRKVVAKMLDLCYNEYVKRALPDFNSQLRKREILFGVLTSSGSVVISCE